MQYTLVEELLQPRNEFLSETGLNSWFYKQVTGYDKHELQEFTYRLDHLKNKSEGHKLIGDITDSIAHLDRMMDDDIGHLALRTLKLGAGTWAFTTGTVITLGITTGIAAGFISGIASVAAAMHATAATASLVPYMTIGAALAPVIGKVAGLTALDILQSLKKAYVAIIKETEKKMAKLDY